MTAHTAPTLLDGSHVLAFLVGAAVCGVVARLVVLYAEREAERSDDLDPVALRRSLGPRSVPPASAHSNHPHRYFDAGVPDGRQRQERAAREAGVPLVPLTDPDPARTLYDVEAEG